MNSKGFTLLETLAATAIMLILTGILTIAFMQSGVIFQATDISATLQANSRQAINKMALDLNRTNTITSQGQLVITQNVPSQGTDQVSYRVGSSSGTAINWGPVVTINLEAGGTGRLIKSDGTVLANHVNGVSFFDHGRDASLYLNELRVVLNLSATSREGRVYNLVSTAIINMRN